MKFEQGVVYITDDRHEELYKYIGRCTEPVNQGGVLLVVDDTGKLNRHVTPGGEFSPETRGMATRLIEAKVYLVAYTTNGVDWRISQGEYHSLEHFMECNPAAINGVLLK